MEAFLAWLAENVAWDALKRSLPLNKQREFSVVQKALEDAQNRNGELERDRELLAKVIQQRNVAINALTEAKREIAQLKKELRAAKKRD